MSRVSPHPNFIIIGGDIPAHGLTDPKAALDAFRGTLKTTANTFRGVPVILTLGNNDFFPRYSINTPMQPWLATLATEILEPLNIFPTQQSNSDFRNNGYYYIVMEEYNLRILSVNTVVFSPYYQAYPPPTDQQDQHLTWITNQLNEAKQLQQNVFIIGHVPPTTIVWHNETQWHPQWVDAYFKVLEPFGEIIQGQFFTHTHRDTFVFSDVQSKNNAVPVLLSPSISPNSETNPSFRVYLFTNEMENNIKKLNLVDYVEYYTDFLNPKTKATGELIWKLEYDFNIAYNQTRVDAPALLDLLRQLREDPAVYAIWRARCDSLFDPERFAYICSIEYPRQEDFLKCLRETNPESYK